MKFLKGLSFKIILLIFGFTITISISNTDIRNSIKNVITDTAQQVVESVAWRDVSTTRPEIISWDAVTTLVNGSPIPTGNTVKYNVYIVDIDNDPTKSNPTLLTPDGIIELTYSIQVNKEGRYIVGVSALRILENGVALNESGINWSDVNGESTPNPFGLKYYEVLPIPENLR